MKFSAPLVTWGLDVKPKDGSKGFGEYSLLIGQLRLVAGLCGVGKLQKAAITSWSIMGESNRDKEYQFPPLISRNKLLPVLAAAAFASFSFLSPLNLHFIYILLGSSKNMLIHYKICISVASFFCCNVFLSLHYIALSLALWWGVFLWFKWRDTDGG